MELFQKRVIIVTGHYGSGKTNLAVNIAFDLAAGGRKTCLVDLDIVNPYFRADDSRAALEAAGVRVIAPLYARSNLDVPALPGEINAVFDDRSYSVILDVGGDDAGAAALGRYAPVILKENDFEHMFVLNARRALTQHPDESAAVLREVEKAGRVPVTALVNNTNLAGETDASVVTGSLAFAQKAALLTGLPLAFTSVEKRLANSLPEGIGAVYPVEICVRAPW